MFNSKKICTVYALTPEAHALTALTRKQQEIEPLQKTGQQPDPAQHRGMTTWLKEYLLRKHRLHYK